MARLRTVIAVGLGVLALSTASAWSIPAQPSGEPPPVPAAGKVSVQDALARPFDFAFARPTRIDEVATALGKTLGAQVVLDRAAMARLDVRPDDTVQLELKGVRLRTGLRLLLDQLDMTYRVEADDNLLVLTDPTGAGDPFNRVLSEIEALHKDVHSLQDAVEALKTAMGVEPEGEKLRTKKRVPFGRNELHFDKASVVIGDLPAKAPMPGH